MAHETELILAYTELIWSFMIGLRGGLDRN